MGTNATKAIAVDVADCLVIGAGVAGLSAALEAAQHGRVIVLCKGAPADSNTFHAQGGVAAALMPGDSPADHAADTIAAGAGLCDARAVEALCAEGPERVLHLAGLGCPFDRQADGAFRAAMEGAHQRARVIPALGDATGRAIAQTLLAQLPGQPRIEPRPGARVLELLLESGRCRGLLAIDETGRPHVYLARAVILASGGCGRLFARTTGPFCDGQGLAMAARAGAVLADMEFVQFHPTALDAPGADPLPLVSEAVRGHGAHLIDDQGRRFMPGEHPMAELAPRDVVARAIFRRLAAGRRVFLDARMFGDHFAARFPQVNALCQRHGLDPARDPLPVTPAAHFLMGGVACDLDGATTVPGLFACGECARVGVHGANRLASNSLLEGLVFGRRAGRAAFRRPAPAPPLQGQAVTPAQLTRWLPPGVSLERCLPGHDDGQDDGQEPAIARLRQLMWRDVGLIRHEDGLARAAAQVARLAREAAPGQISLANMCAVAEAIIAAARQRKTSVGAHFRADGPAMASGLAQGAAS